MKTIALAMLVLAAVPAAAQSGPKPEIETPSGLKVTLEEVILDPATTTARFRFLAPALDPAGEAVAFDTIAGDFPWLCETWIIPALRANDWSEAKVVISLMDRDVPFGQSDPDATQFFDAYSTDETDACTWEPF